MTASDTTPVSDADAQPYVLLAEDEVSIRAAFARLLRREKFRVVEAGSGEEAFRAVEREGFAPILLITDVVMPGIGGKELVQRLRETAPDLRVVMMSGYSEDLSLRIELGSDRLVFLQKPFGTQVLLAAVREALAMPSARSSS